MTFEDDHNARVQECTDVIEAPFEECSTIVKIGRVFKGMGQLLTYKNQKYGDSALSPCKIFSRLPAEEQILIRLDDKMKRIMNSDEGLRKNDVADVMGYLVLLCCVKGWYDFKEFMD